MAIGVWPVADRQRIIRAFRPSETTVSEAPFRTLRGHQWASAGKRVTQRAGARLTGQMTVFSALNVDSARLARHGYSQAATRLAKAAERLEAGPEFAQLQRELCEVSEADARSVVEGSPPRDLPPGLTSALQEVARITAKLRSTEPVLADLAEVTAGQVSEVHETHVVLAVVDGLGTVLPRWMAVAVHRDQVGELLALVLDRLNHATAVAEAVPAIEFDDGAGGAFSPFGRGSRSVVEHLSRDDERLLAGEPAPLKVIVPVRINE